MTGTPRIRAASIREKSAAVLVTAIALVAAACGGEPPTEQPSASPTAGPPSMRVATTFASQFDGQRFTFQVIVDPHDSPTDVAYEFGTGSAYDHTIEMATSVLDPGQVSVTSDAIPSDMAFCGRFVATNALGRASLEESCHTLLVPPGAPSATGAPSALP